MSTHAPDTVGRGRPMRSFCSGIRWQVPLHARNPLGKLFKTDAVQWHHLQDRPEGREDSIPE